MPYIFAINLLYFFSVFYFGYIFHIIFKNKIALFFGILIAFLNPFMMSNEWFYILREPLSSISDVVMLASSLALAFYGFKIKSLPHLLIFSLIFLFNQFFREEDILRWFYVFILIYFLLYKVNFKKKFIYQSLVIILILFLTQQIIDNTYRIFVKNFYGLPIKHELSEGEFPKFLSNLRSISSGNDNRLAQIKWTALERLSILAPEFKPLFDNLPIPNHNSISCIRYGVCKEWSYGYLSFWILHASTSSGIASNLMESQDYFRNLNKKIKELCYTKEFSCNPENSRLVPGFKLKWTRALFDEVKRNLSLIIYPEIEAYHNKNNTNYSKFDTPDYKFVLGLSRNFWITQNYGLEFNKLRANTLPVLRILFFSLLIILTLYILIKPIIFPGYTLTPIYIVSAAYFIYSIFRLFILSYIAIYFGSYEDRMFYPTYTGLIALISYTIYDFVNSKRNYYEK